MHELDQATSSQNLNQRCQVLIERFDSLYSRSWSCSSLRSMTNGTVGDSWIGRNMHILVTIKLIMNSGSRAFRIELY